MSEARRRREIDPVWFAPVLIVVVVSVVAVTWLKYTGALRTYIPVTLISDRSGLVMDPRAPVKFRGVPVGEVATIGADLDSAKLDLKLFPDAAAHLPSNVQAEIKATTIFGGKYVDLILPSDPSPTRLAAGAVLHSRNVTVEVNTVFQNLSAVLDAIEPAKLNAILAAVSEAVRGKGEVMGQAITAANNVLLAVNPRMQTVQQDFRQLGMTADIYSDAAQNILNILDGLTTTATTISGHRSAVDALLTSALGFGQTGFDVIGGNAPNLVRSINLLEPTTNLLMKYQPSFTCLLMGAKWYLDNAEEAVGGNGRTAVVDAALLFGDDPYRYPKNLPLVNATGGPGGRPGCGSLPDASANYPVRALVTDTGYGTDPGDLRSHPGLGHPWWVNFLPVTRAVPEPPAYHGLPR